MLTIIFWVTFGATIGWVATILRGEKEPRRALLYMLAGGLGGLAGGFVGGLLSPSAPGYYASTTDIMFAVFGATAFVLVTGLVTALKTQRRSG